MMTTLRKLVLTGNPLRTLRRFEVQYGYLSMCVLLLPYELTQQIFILSQLIGVWTYTCFVEVSAQ